MTESDKMAEGANAGAGTQGVVDIFPCVLAAPRNFHLFVQDDLDVWAPTLDQLNSGTYDPLKLKRVSFYLDVGLPHGNPMAFAFDGSLIIPRNPHLKSADDAVDEFNRVVAAMGIGGIRLPQVGSSDLAFGSLYATGYFRYEHPHGILPTLHQAFGEASAGGYFNIQLLEPLRISKGEVERALASGRPVLDAAHRIDPATLVMAISHHLVTEYRSSLVYSWLIVEQLVGQIWDEMFIPSRTSGFQERVGQLQTVGRTAGARIEFLVESGLIDRKSYGYIQRARKARNDLVHRGSKPNQGDSYFSLVAVTHLLQLVCASRDVTFTAETVLQGLGRRSGGKSEEGVMKAHEVDWSKSGYWRAVKPIPGDTNWAGEYQKYPGIEIARVAR